MKVYLVTQGSYSDYRVLAAFSDEGEARTLAAYDDRQVEEFALLEKCPEQVIEYTRNATVFPSGTVNESQSAQEVFVGIEGTPPECSASRPNVSTVPDLSIWLYVHGTDRERVDKVYGEQLAQTKAQADLMFREALSDSTVYERFVRRYAASRPTDGLTPSEFLASVLSEQS